MTSEPGTALRVEQTPCLLFPELFERGGGLQRAVQERASLYARHARQVLVLTTGFTPDWRRVPAALEERGSLDSRVEVRNFFAHSAWAARLGTPPEHAHAHEDGITSRPQGLVGARPLRLADVRTGERRPFRYRYFDADGAPLLTTFPGPANKHEQTALDPDGQAVSWPQILAAWVDDEIADVPSPVLFSLQRGLNDPVLLASTRAARKVASLHNCHYKDPADRRSGIRPSFRPLFARAEEVDEVVCLTTQQRRELRRDVPGARVRAVPYPGRTGTEAPVAKDPDLVVLVGQLVARKRVDHAVRAMVDVVAAVPTARLEVYGEGPEAGPVQALVDELGLQASVRLMGYSPQVGQAQARAACTLMTSTFEGFARVISESMSRGTPVVSYDVRYGPRDLVRPGVDGLLVDDHRPEALAAAVVSLLADPARAAEMGARAREVVQRFRVADFERAWLDVLTGPARRRVVSRAAGRLLARVRVSARALGLVRRPAARRPAVGRTAPSTSAGAVGGRSAVASA